MTSNNGVNYGIVNQGNETLTRPGPGRPKGARNKLSEAFLSALGDDFELHGKEVIEKVRGERPHDYLKIVALATPRRMEIEDVAASRLAEELTDDELAAIASAANVIPLRKAGHAGLGDVTLGDDPLGVDPAADS